MSVKRDSEFENFDRTTDDLLKVSALLHCVRLTQPGRRIESHLEEFEEREWLKKKLGYRTA